MNSIALWYKSDSTNVSLQPTGPHLPCQLSIHLNYWKVNQKKAKQISFKAKTYKYYNKLEEVSFLDAGLFIENPQNVEIIYLFIPYKFEPGVFNIEDLGKNLKERPELVYAIFNEKLKVSVATGSKFINVTNEQDPTKNFDIYVLDDASDFEYEEKFNGTLLKIKVPSIKPNPTSPLYFRIRIKGPFVDTLRVVYRPRNRLFESGFSEIEVLDFRVQEIRNLHPTLLQEMSLNKNFLLKKIHLLILRSARDEIMFHSGTLHSSRILEKGLWKSYFSENVILDEIFAYHVKSTQESPNAPIEDFVAGFKFRVERISWKTIIFYFVLTLIIAYFVEFTAPSLKTYLENGLERIQGTITRIFTISKTS